MPRTVKPEFAMMEFSLLMGCLEACLQIKDKMVPLMIPDSEAPEAKNYNPFKQQKDDIASLIQKLKPFYDEFRPSTAIENGAQW